MTTDLTIFRKQPPAAKRASMEAALQINKARQKAKKPVLLNLLQHVPIVLIPGTRIWTPAVGNRKLLCR